MATLKEKYSRTLAERRKKTRVSRRFQLIGLEISQILRDERHKALYIKLAKEANGDRLLRIAKEVAERKGVKNKGAYFMKMIQDA